MIRITVVLILFPLITCSQSRKEKRKKGEIVISGEISNEEVLNSKIYAIYLDGSKKMGWDSTQVINGKYKLRAETGVTTLITLYTKIPDDSAAFDEKNMLTFLSEPTSVIISSTGNLSNAHISGSKANLEYLKLSEIREPYTKQLDELYRRQSSEPKENSTKGVILTETKIDSVHEALAEMYKNYIESNPSSLALPYSFYFYMFHHRSTTGSDYIQRKYNELSKKNKKTYYAQQIKKSLASLSIAIGNLAPSFTQNDIIGKPVSLSSCKGQYVLLDFWASWCDPCRKENPTLVNLYNKYKEKGFTIISISLDKATEKSKWLEASKKDGLTWTHLSDLRFWENS